MHTQAHLFIKGDVTGVGFRAWARMLAMKAGLNGWIRNVYNDPDRYGPHGGVEAVLQGSKEAIHDVIDDIKKGSEISRVDDIDVSYENPTETFHSFDVVKSEAFSHQA